MALDSRLKWKARQSLCWVGAAQSPFQETISTPFKFELKLHLCPTYQLWPFSFPPENFPPNQKLGPQTEFPGIPWTGVFSGNSTEHLIFRNFLAHPGFSSLGPPFSALLGEIMLICWGNAEIKCGFCQCHEMGPKVGKKWVSGCKSGRKWVKQTTLYPLSDPFQ